MDADRQADDYEADDAALRELLAAHVVPEPSADFVDDTLLRIQLDAHDVPEPSPGFVDRVLTGLAAEGLVGDSPHAGEPGVASRPATPIEAAEVGERRLRLVPLLLAAAVLLGFLLPNLIRGTGNPEAFLDSPSTTFAEVSSVTFDDNATEHGLRSPRSDVVPAIWLPGSPERTDEGAALLEKKWRVTFK